MRKNQASQKIDLMAISSTDGSGVTTGMSMRVKKDGGTWSASAGTLTHKEDGCWEYTPTQAETDADHIVFKLVGAGAITAIANVYTTSLDPHDTADAGMTNLDVPVSNAATPAQVGAELDSRRLNRLMQDDFVWASHMNALSFFGRMMVQDGMGSKYTAAALENAPGATAAEVWAESGRSLSDVSNITNNPLVVDASGHVTLADGPHGGVAAVLNLERMIVISTTGNEPAIKAEGSGTGDGLYLSAGASGGDGLFAMGGPNGSGIRATCVGPNGSGIWATGQGSGFDIWADINGVISSVGNVVEQSNVEGVEKVMIRGQVTNSQQAPTNTVVDVDFSGATDSPSGVADNYAGRDLTLLDGSQRHQARRVIASSQITVDIVRFTLEGTGFQDVPNSNDSAAVV